MDEAALRMAVVDVEEHALVWIVHWTSETFVRTGDPAFMLAGSGPYLVDRVDGGRMRSASSLRLRGRGRTTTGAVYGGCRFAPPWMICTMRSVTSLSRADACMLCGPCAGGSPCSRPLRPSST
ncbi:YrhB domain-containing protein [Streptomyces anulatus]